MCLPGPSPHPQNELLLLLLGLLVILSVNNHRHIGIEDLVTVIKQSLPRTEAVACLGVALLLVASTVLPEEWLGVWKCSANAW